MIKFDNELFNTLTASEERFRSAIEIVEQFHLIKEQLISDFWEAVVSELDYLLSSEGCEFIIERKYGNLYISLQKGDNIYVCLEDLEAQQRLSLIVEYNKINGKIKFKEYAEGIFLNEFKIVDDEWCAYKLLDDNLSENKWIIEILPFQREIYVKQKAKDLFDFTMKYKKHMEYIRTLFLYRS